MSMLAIEAPEAADRVCSSPHDELEVHPSKTTKAAVAPRPGPIRSPQTRERRIRNATNPADLAVSGLWGNRMRAARTPLRVS